MRSARARTFTLCAAIGLAIALVNASSVLDERASLGLPIQAWQAWTWELTSYASWLMLLPLIIRAASKIRPPRYSLPASAGLHLLFSVLMSLAHVGIMVALREIIYAALGEDYGLRGPLLRDLIYEFRKDLITYTGIAAAFLLVERATKHSDAAEAPPIAPIRLEVRDGSRSIWLSPDDIRWAEAAGNYVELRGAFGSVLHRETLSSLEKRLAPFGFARIHRSRIVRVDQVRSVLTRASGDFEVTLENGEKIPGSRRFRDRLSAPPNRAA